MRGTRFVIFPLLATALLAVLCFGPWREVFAVTATVAFIKVIGLAAIFVATLRIYLTGSKEDPNRLSWLILGLSFLSSVIGQSVLCYHQVILRIYAPFPSLADPFYVLYAPLVIYALFAFCYRAGKSGLFPGSAIAFWWPAIAVLGVSVVGLPVILTPVVDAGGTWQEMFLNVYYPVISFIALAPCMVILRFGLKFRGGNLLWVWLLLTLGFLAILAADIFYAYFSAVGISATEGLMDFLYGFGYIIIPTAVFYQGQLQKS